MEFSSEDLLFHYQSEKHLKTTLKLKNTTNYNQLFKVLSIIS